MPKHPQPNDIVLARRKAGYGSVSVASALPPFEGWQPAADELWSEGGTIPMRYEEAVAREDCEPVLKESD